jgi:hypothetical protein
VQKDNVNATRIPTNHDFARHWCELTRLCQHRYERGMSVRHWRVPNNELRYEIEGLLCTRRKGGARGTAWSSAKINEGETTVTVVDDPRVLGGNAGSSDANVTIGA